MRHIDPIACACLLLIAPLGFPQQSDTDGSEAILKALAEAYKDTRTIEQIKKDNALIRAAANSDVEGVRAAIKNGALVNSRYLDGFAFLSKGVSGYTALMRASLAGHQNAVKVLIDAKADLELESDGRTSLYMAAINGNDSVTKLLVEAGAKGDPRQLRLSHDLLRAACRGFKMREGEGFPLYPGSIGDPENAPEIWDVLKRGADVNAADPRGHTALMFAANLGLVANVKVLLANGADVKRMSLDGETALSLAERPNSSVAKEGRRLVVEVLKAHLAK